MHVCKSWILAPLVVVMAACSSSDSDDSNNMGTADGASQNEGMTTDPGPDTTGESTGGNAGTPVVSGNVAFLGFMEASYDPLDDATEWNAQFLRSPNLFPASSLNEEVLDTIATDQCQEVDSTIPDIDSDTSDDIDNLPFIPELVSAGDTITITSPAGTYATLLRENVFGFTTYQTADDVPVAGTIPTGLTADIPGAADGFPALSNIALPSAAPIEFRITGNTLTWTGATTTDAVVDILFGAVADGNVVAPTLIECQLIDDGSHVLADGLLPEGSVEYPLFVGNRTVTLIQQSGESFLILTADTEGFLNRN